MGCYAIEARERGIEVVLATNDKDLYQLVNPKVKIYSTAKADLGFAEGRFRIVRRRRSHGEMGRVRRR